jgi:hypothetical protein
MKMVRGGSSAFGPIVENRPAGTQFGHELEKGFDVFSDGLAAMLCMGNGEVGRKNRPGVTEDQVCAPIEEPFLCIGEMIRAEETSPLVRILAAHGCQAALDSSRIILEADGKSPAGDIPLPDIPERFAALPEIQPGLFLLR